MNNVKHPEVAIKLTGTDGNGFSIIARCIQAARRAKVDPADIAAFRTEAMSGDYDNLLRTCMKYFDVR